jgi:tRNA(Ile2) C34 agmatinyltransferase TiaS
MGILKKLFIDGTALDPKSRCSFCGKKLKKRGRQIYSTCRHCGRTQPWADGSTGS